MRRSKPYFKKDVEDKIVSVVMTELAKDKKSVDEAAIRRYIQAPKNTYENSILSDVADGKVLATVVRDEIAYKVNSPSEQEIEEVIDAAKKKSGDGHGGIPSPTQVDYSIKQTRAAKLSHALNMVSHYGKVIKLGVEAVSVAQDAVESKATSTQSTAV